MIANGRSPSMAWWRNSSSSIPTPSCTYAPEKEDGESVVWACEMQTANTLRRQGWTEDRFTVGQAVTVSGIAARRDPLGCSFTSAELTDGTMIGRSGAVVPPPESASGDAPRAAFLEGGIPNLAGPWMRDRSRGRGGPGPGSTRPGADRLTPAGLAAAEGYDERFARSLFRVQRLEHHPRLERARHADGYRSARRSRRILPVCACGRPKAWRDPWLRELARADGQKTSEGAASAACVRHDASTG